jgi:hypothetical protein
MNPRFTQKYENFKLPLTPTLSPRKRVERKIRNFFRNFFGTVALSLWLSQNHKTPGGTGVLTCAWLDLKLFPI